MKAVEYAVDVDADDEICDFGFNNDTFNNETCYF